MFIIFDTCSLTNQCVVQDEMTFIYGKDTLFWHYPHGPIATPTFISPWYTWAHLGTFFSSAGQFEWYQIYLKTLVYVIKDKMYHKALICNILKVAKIR